jgi:sugar-specific transcriptional regulator TrmB
VQRGQLSSASERDEIKEEAESILRELGLSSHAAKSFIAISENSPLAATTLCEKTGIADSKIYYALKELEEKGLVVKSAGTPQLYSALKSGEACDTFGKMIESEHAKRKTKLARLEKILKPLSASSRRSEDLEIAYIARGFDNVAKRAISLLKGAERDVTGYIWDDDLYSSLSESLTDLSERDVKTRLALNPQFAKRKAEGRLLPVFYPNNRKNLLCECNLLVVDRKKMINITRTRASTYYAIITEDPGMISLGVSYYDNPACCALVK